MDLLLGLWSHCLVPQTYVVISLRSGYGILPRLSNLLYEWDGALMSVPIGRRDTHGRAFSRLASEAQFGHAKRRW